LFLGISGPSKKAPYVPGTFLVLSCVVFQHLAPTHFSDFWSSWVVFGLPGSGRAALDQGSLFATFWVALFVSKMCTWILPKSIKTNGFGAIYAQGRFADIVAIARPVPKAGVFLRF
jgi:hypothetical protein